MVRTEFFFFHFNMGLFPCDSCGP